MTGAGRNRAACGLLIVLAGLFAAGCSTNEIVQPRPEDVIWKKVEKSPVWTGLDINMLVDIEGASEFPVTVDIQLTEGGDRFGKFVISFKSLVWSYDLNVCVTSGKPDLSSISIEYYADEQPQDFEFLVHLAMEGPEFNKSGIAGYDRYQISLSKGGRISECYFIPHE